MMPDPFLEKTKEFLTKAQDFENNGEFDNAIKIVTEAMSFIEGYRIRENNPMMSLYYSNYKGIWSMWRRILETNKKIDPTASKIDVRQNNLESRIKRLEERFDKIQKWQDNQDQT